MTPQAEVLIRLVKEHDWRWGAELGVLAGETFFALLDACPALSMVGVDIWRQQPEKDRERERGGRGYVGRDMQVLGARVAARAEHYGNRARLHKMPTVEVATHFDDGQFDFVFIDADHLYEAVKADIDAWRPKVRPGGMLLGHDYQADFPGVIEAVHELLGEPILYGNTVWGAIA